MKRKLRNIVMAICIIVLSLCSITALSACSRNTKADFALASDRLWLTRYEEKELEFLEGDGSGITYTVKDPSIVTVENNRFIAQGEGETQVTLKSEKAEAVVTVTVRDDGTFPTIAINDEADACVYKDVETELPFYISYGGAEYPLDDYTLSVGSKSTEYLAVDGKKITGLKLTEEDQKVRVTVNCVYKGLELEETFKIAVKDTSYIKFGKESLDVYNGDTTLKAYAIIPQEAIYKGQPITSEDLTAEIVKGKDKVDVYQDPDTGISKVVAKASEGQAIVKVSYTDQDGGSVEAMLDVVLHPAYVETEFVLADVAKGSLFEDVSDRSGIFNGRDGVKKYIADPLARESFIGSGKQLNQQNLKLSTDRNFEAFRLEVPEKAERVSDLYHAGYRYFTYDVYVKTDAKEADIPSMPLCLYGSARDQGFNELFCRDGVYIIQNGEITNRLAANGWMTVVFDLYTIAARNPSANALFYFAVNDKLSVVYLDNVRYYLDGSFLPNGGLPEYEKNLKYEKQSDGSIAVVEGSAFVPYFSNNLSVEKADGYITSRVGEAGDNHKNAYMLTSITGGAWNSSALLVPSMAESYYDGVTRLRSYGKYVMFDMYVISAEKINFRLNHFNPSAAFDEKSDITTPEYYWIDIIDKQTGKACKTFERGIWQTVVLHYNEAVYANGWSANLAIGIDNKGGKLLIDNVRFLQEYTAPAEVKPLGARERFKSLVIGGTEGWSNYYMDANGEYVLEFAHNKDRAKYWSAAGIKFNVKDNIGENNYLRFRFKFNSIDPYGQTMYIYAKGENIAAREWAMKGVTCYDSAGNQCSYDQLKAGEWYDLYVRIADKTGKPDEYYVVFYQNDYSTAAEHPEITAWIKNVGFTKTDEGFIPYEALSSHITLGNALTPNFYMDGADAAVKTTHAIGNSTGSANVQFNVPENTESEYIKFMWRVDAIQGETRTYDKLLMLTIGSQNQKLVRPQSWSASYEKRDVEAYGLYVYEPETKARIRSQDMIPGNWYECYIKLEKDADNNVVGTYSLAAVQDDYYNFEEHPNVYSYLKGIEYTDAIPYEKLQSHITLGTSLTPEFYMDGSDEAVKLSHNFDRNSMWSAVGVQFYVKDNIGENNYLKFSFKFDALEDSSLSQSMYIHNKGKDISASNWANSGVTCFDAAGNQLSYSELKPGQWYDLQIEITDKTGAPGQYYVVFYQTDYANAASHPQITAYIKNVEYLKGEEPAKDWAIDSQIVLGDALTTQHYMDGADEAVKVSHNYDRNAKWSAAGVQFKVKDNIGDNNYLKFSFKFDALEDSSLGQTMYIHNKGKDISASNWANSGVTCFDAAGNQLSYSELQPGQWYDLQIEITDKTGTPGQYYVVFYQTDYANAATHPQITAYIKNVEYLKVEEPAKDWAIDSQIVLGDALTTQYYMDGADEAVKVSHNYDRNAKWSAAGVQFKVKDNIGENDYLRFSFKFDALEDSSLSQTMYIHNKGKDISASNWANSDVICLDASGNAHAYNELQPGQWYDLYIKITDKTGTPGQYYVVFYQPDYANAATHPDITAYVKNVGYVSNVPFATLRSQITMGASVASQSSYSMDGTDEMVTVWHKNIDENGANAIHFNTDQFGAADYVKFMYKIDALSSDTAKRFLKVGIGTQNKITVWSGSSTYGTKESVEAYGLYIYDLTTGDTVRAQDMQADVWYEICMKIQKDENGNVQGSYSLATMQEGKDNIAAENRELITVHLKNVEYLKAEEPEKDWTIDSQVVLGSALTTQYYMDGADEAVKVSHNYDRNAKWSAVGVQFKVKDKIGENDYLKFSFKFDALEDSSLSQTMYIHNKGKDISASNWANSDVICLDASGNARAYNELQPGQWYDLYIKITDKTGTPGQYYVVFYQTDYANAATHPDITAYVKNVGYVSNVPFATLRSQITMGASVASQSSYSMDGTDEMVTVWHKNIDENGANAIHFNTDQFGAADYVKFMYKIDALSSDTAKRFLKVGIGTQNKITVWSGSSTYGTKESVEAYGLYIYDLTTGDTVRAQDMQADVWYEICMKIQKDESGNVQGSYSLATMQEGKDNIAAENRELITVHLKNVEYLNVSFAEIESQIKLGSALTTQYYMDGKNAAVKTAHAIGNSSGSANAQFNVPENTESEYIKFMWRIDAIQGETKTYDKLLMLTIGSQSQKLVRPQSWSDSYKRENVEAYGLYVCEPTTKERIRTQDMIPGNWYECYIKLEKDADNNVVGTYSLAAVQDEYYSFEEHPNVYSYFRNVEYTDVMP